MKSYAYFQLLLMQGGKCASKVTLKKQWSSNPLNCKSPPSYLGWEERSILVLYQHKNLELLVVALTLYTDVLTLLNKYSSLKAASGHYWKVVAH